VVALPIDRGVEMPSGPVWMALVMTWGPQYYLSVLGAVMVSKTKSFRKELGVYPGKTAATDPGASAEKTVVSHGDTPFTVNSTRSLWVVY